MMAEMASPSGGAAEMRCLDYARHDKEGGKVDMIVIEN